MQQPSLDAQRLAFGRVAELYDRARPSYPPATIEALLEAARLRVGSRVLEVGAGTGKATRLLAERGLDVTALEPDVAMAAVAERNCAAYANVRVERRAFESYRSAGRFDAVVSVQAWHWTDPATRYRLAAEALHGDGTLAAIWTFPEWATTPLRDALRGAYARAAPALRSDFPMHPASAPTRLAGDWQRETIESGAFEAPAVRRFPWSLSYSPDQYVDLLQTHQDHILLADHARAALLDAVTETVRDAGAIDLDFVTRLCTARAANTLEQAT